MHEGQKKKKKKSEKSENGQKEENASKTPPCTYSIQKAFKNWFYLQIIFLLSIWFYVLRTSVYATFPKTHIYLDMHLGYGKEWRKGSKLCAIQKGGWQLTLKFLNHNRNKEEKTHTHMYATLAAAVQLSHFSFS